MKAWAKTVAAAALLTGASGIANTAHAEGWYGRIDVGQAMDGSTHWADGGGNGSATFDFFSNDMVASAAIGRRLDRHIRVEGEIAHRTNEMKPIPLDLDNGQLETWSAMINLIADFNTGGALQPYVGVGMGVAQIDGDLYNSDNPEIIHDTDTHLAFQGMLGIAYHFTPSLALDLGYRYFTFRGGDFSGTDGGDPETWTVNYDQQSVTLGLRWNFGTN